MAANDDVLISVDVVELKHFERMAAINLRCDVCVQYHSTPVLCWRIGMANPNTVFSQPPWRTLTA